MHEVIEPRDGQATHSARPPDRRLRLIAAVIGGAAALVAATVGTVALQQSPSPAHSSITTAQFITVSVPPATIPLSAPQLTDLLAQHPDFGPLSDPARRASCLTGLGYPGTAPVLGATPVQVNNRPGVVLVLQGDAPAQLTALAVAPNCSSAGTGLLADTTVARP